MIKIHSKSIHVYCEENVNFGEEMGSPSTYFHQTQMVEPPSTNPSSQERRNMQSGDFEAAGLGVDQRLVFIP